MPDEVYGDVELAVPHTCGGNDVSPATQDSAIRAKTGVPSKMIFATTSGFAPSSVASILSVSFGLTLFSSSYPGLYIVPGNATCTSISYNMNSDCRVSARPVLPRATSV